MLVIHSVLVVVIHDTLHKPWHWKRLLQTGPMMKLSLQNECLVVLYMADAHSICGSGIVIQWCSNIAQVNASLQVHSIYGQLYNNDNNNIRWMVIICILFVWGIGIISSMNDNNDDDDKEEMAILQW